MLYFETIKLNSFEILFFMMRVEFNYLQSMEYTKRQLLICFQNFGAFQVIINKQINVDNYTLHVSNEI